VADSRSHVESKLDEALEEASPASDPPATAGGAVRDNRTKNRFEISVNGETAFLLYNRTDDALTLIHTEVPTALRGRHLGDRLVEAALQSARSAGLRIIAVCPFARAYMRKHPAPR